MYRNFLDIQKGRPLNIPQPVRHPGRGEKEYAYQAKRFAVKTVEVLLKLH